MKKHTKKKVLGTKNTITIYNHYHVSNKQEKEPKVKSLRKKFIDLSQFIATIVGFITNLETIVKFLKLFIETIIKFFTPYF